MRCDGIILIGEEIELNGVLHKVVTVGPLDPKTDCYEFITKFKVSKEAVDELIRKNVLDTE